MRAVDEDLTPAVVAESVEELVNCIGYCPVYLAGERQISRFCKNNCIGEKMEVTLMIGIDLHSVYHF